MANELVKAADVNLSQITPETAKQLLSTQDIEYCDKIKEMYVNRLLSENDWWWDVGCLAIEVCSAVDNAKTALTGDRKLELMAIAQGWDDIVIQRLKDAAFVVDRWGTKENFHKLTALQDSEGWCLSFYHIRTISRIQDNEAAFEYAQHVMERRLSVKDLQKQIKEEASVGVRKKGAGRPMSVPKTTDDCLKNMIKKMEALPRAFSEAWFGDRFDLARAIEEVSDEELNTPTFLNNLNILNDIVVDADKGIELTKKALKELIQRANWSVLEYDDEEPSTIEATVAKNEVVAPAVEEAPQPVIDNSVADIEEDEEDVEEDVEEEEAPEPPRRAFRKPTVPAKSMFSKPKIRR